MSQRCMISGKTVQKGNRVSHAKNRTKHDFKPNLQTKKIFVGELGRTIKLKLSTRIIRTIDKIGFTETLRKHKVTLKDLVKN